MISNDDLRRFNGTENYYKELWGLTITDGVRYAREKLELGWLIGDIASVWSFEKKVLENKKENSFLVVVLKINDNKAVLTFSEDYDEGKPIKLLYTQKYEWTDIKNFFSDNELKFYLVDGVLLLPSEY